MKDWNTMTKEEQTQVIESKKRVRAAAIVVGKLYSDYVTEYTCKAEQIIRDAMAAGVELSDIAAAAAFLIHNIPDRYDSRITRANYDWADVNYNDIVTMMDASAMSDSKIHRCHLNSIVDAIRKIWAEYVAQTDAQTDAAPCKRAQKRADHYRVHAPTARRNSDKVLNALYHHCEQVIASFDPDTCAAPDISISAGNSKIGRTPSVSRPPVFCCGDCTHCKERCYAVRMYTGRNKKAIQPAWDRNMILSMFYPETYFGKIADCMKLSRFFRWHVSGDITSAAYLQGMIDAANAAPGCTAMAFTECHKIVNDYCKAHGGRAAIPENLVIIFSIHHGQIVDNPYNFPEAHIIPEDPAEKTLSDGDKYFLCPGNCEQCQLAGVGCWALRDGEKVAFNEH